MSSFETTDTEETVTCLRITVYHPRQEEQQVFRALEFCQPQQLRADEMVKFGRDCNVCQYNFVDPRVSRIQFALLFFRHFNSSEFGFQIKNMSKKVKLIVENNELAYLNKVDLPETCTIRFGDYQMLMQKQEGQSEDYFNVRFELAKMSLWQEKNLLLRAPIPDTCFSYADSPVEMDENE
ncbi:TRAF-interacting protein with FHA domain-containing protein A [Elgaria multicarinata webbii]|uniref:TRAF-interacting protein with FHA domain-containing protein A n=1 Tax=Elgaria multicarinata webbii TaxID=159646 RepID=UPI002FCCDE11